MTISQQFLIFILTENFPLENTKYLHKNNPPNQKLLFKGMHKSL